MSFPRFTDSFGEEFAVNPAHVSRVFNIDHAYTPPPGGQPTTRIRIVDTALFGADGRCLMGIAPEDVTVLGKFDQVLNKLNAAQRSIVEACQ